MSPRTHTPFARARSFAAVLALALASPGLPAEDFVPAQARVAAIAAALPEQPAGIGAPATDRKRWKAAADSIPAKELLAAAQEAMRGPPPELPDELYLRFSRDGNRDAYQAVSRSRLERMNLFAWAEGVEHRGRFVAPLAREIEAILSEKTWVLPAHDPKLDNFSGRVAGADLMSAMRAWSLATVAHWNADQLDPALVARLRAEIRRRLLDPFLQAVRGGWESNGLWWIRADNNWNAVCNAGVAGAALATVESRAERAEILGFVELNLEYYLRGFTADGYCSEGIGYWNYGFGHFAMISEVLAAATGGVVRPLAGDHAMRVAAYPAGLQIIPGVYPAFADMNPREKASSWFGALAVRQVYPKPLGMKPWNLQVADLRTQLAYESGLKAFLAVASIGLPAAPAPRISADSYWFADAQVYVGRAADAFGVAMKGGHNAEHHNHNDVGSFVVARGDRAVLVDPGSEVYTARTFGPDRYASKVLSSYGHPVPVVAGALQPPGREHAARVVTTEFSPAQDRVVLDLAAAYRVPALRSLGRSLTLRRGAQPELIIEDRVEFAEPSAFETALVTFEPWREIGPGRWRVGEGASAVRVDIRVTGADWSLKPEVLAEDLPGKRQPTRLGIRLSSPVASATVEVRVRPE